MTTLKRGSKGEEVKTLQNKLNAFGNYGLIVDGIFGELTDEAVRIFQKAKGLSVDGIVGPKTWDALGVVTATANKRKITEIIVHCAATPEGKDYTVADIKKWHLQRGFSDIGYHWVVYRDGSINKGRDESKSGAHCTGHNTNSIGICYIGGMDAANKNAKDTRTEAQKASLLKKLKELKAQYPGAKIRGHRDFAAKACPSFDATKEYANI